MQGGSVMKRAIVCAVLSAVLLCGCNSKPVQILTSKPTEQERPTSVLYTLQERENQDYDVSPYRVKDRSFYENPKVVIDEEELKEFAGSRLDKITSSTGTDYTGTYKGYEFTIVRADCFANWLELSGYSDRSGERDGLYLQKYRGNYEYEQIDYYKDPSEHFLVVTKCRDNKVICEFFGHS